MNDEAFDLPVEYKDEQFTFPAVLKVYGYTYRFEVTVDEQLIIFERDEEGNIRGLINYNDLNNHSNVDVELIKVIGESIVKFIK